MFGKSPDQKYAHYLAWFEKNVADPKNWIWMRADRDCANWQTKQQSIDSDSGEMKMIDVDPGKPVPWERSMALFKMSDPKAMARALDKKIVSNHNKYTAMSKYINGDPKQGTYSEEYANNYKVLKETQAEIARSYGTSTELNTKQINKILEKHRAEIIEPKEQWKPLNPFQALKHWITGGKIESVEASQSDWRDTLPKEQKHGAKRK